MDETRLIRMEMRGQLDPMDESTVTFPPYYDVQQVCLNGHQITDSYNNSPEFRRERCSECGEPTIHQCPKCQQSIRGRYNLPGVIGGSASVPKRCEKCGEAFPWAERQIAKQATVQGPSDASVLLERIGTRFHAMVCQLRIRREDRSTLDVADEYDVQDLLHAVLRLFFDDIRPEDWTPSYAGKATRIDFVLKNEAVAVEVKKTRAGLGAKEVGAQLIEDIAHYGQHPNCCSLFCFVYDPENRIQNPHGLENDLSKKHGELTVKVLVAPKTH